MYEVHIFPRTLQKPAVWKRFFVFKYPFTCKKNFKIHNNFNEIKANLCLLCAHRVMTSKILHTQRPNCQ